MYSGERICKLRKKKNLTQKELGEMVGVSSTSVCNWEKDNKVPTMSNYIRLSKIFNVKIEYLIGNDNYAVASDDVDYNLMMRSDEMRMVEELRKYPGLYRKLVSEPKRYFKKLKDILS